VSRGGRTTTTIAGRFFDFVVDRFSRLADSLFAARSIIAVSCSPAPHGEPFVDGDDFEVVTVGVRSRAREYGAPKTGV
jgi:hypothetical protein